MKAVQVSVALNKIGIKITVTNLYNNPTIRKLGSLIEDLPDRMEDKSLVQTFIPDSVYTSIPVNAEDVYPISDMQRIMIEEYEKDTNNLGIYHSVTRWRFMDERLSVSALEKAILALQKKNHPLRTVFFSAENDMYQCIKEIDKTTLLVDDISEFDENSQNEYIAKCESEDVKNKFRVDNWDECLIRFKVFVLSRNTFEFMMSFHHAIVDGWGDTVFQNELMEYYINYRDNKPVRDNKLPNSFKEHVLLCNEVSVSNEANDFWWNELKHWKPFNKKRIKPVDFFATKVFYLDKEVSVALKELARKEEVTLKSVFLTNYIKTLGLTLNTNHVSVGVVLNGRTAELSDPINTMGLFWNILPVYFDSLDQVEYTSVQDKLNRSEEFSRFSGHKIKARLGEDPNVACFNYVHFHNSKNWNEKEKNSVEPAEAINKIDIPQILGFQAIEKYHYPLNMYIGVDPFDSNRISIRAEYNQAVFSEEDMDHIIKEYVSMLHTSRNVKYMNI